MAVCTNSLPKRSLSQGLGQHISGHDGAPLGVHRGGHLTRPAPVSEWRMGRIGLVPLPLPGWGEVASSRCTGHRPLYDDLPHPNGRRWELAVPAVVFATF